MSKKKTAKLEDVIQQITEALPDLKLEFKKIYEYITIKPQAWLGTEGFAALQSKIQELGGEYVSAGKLSHFRIPIELKEHSLKEWYENQRQQQQPLATALSLHINLRCTSPEELQNILDILKKNLAQKKE